MGLFDGFFKVENYVEHIRNMLEERESLAAEYERDNEQLRAKLALMKHQQGELNSYWF